MSNVIPFPSRYGPPPTRTKPSHSYFVTTANVEGLAAALAEFCAFSDTHLYRR